jgi:hypothetical protein
LNCCLVSLKVLYFSVNYFPINNFQGKRMSDPFAIQFNEKTDRFSEIKSLKQSIQKSLDLATDYILKNFKMDLSSPDCGGWQRNFGIPNDVLSSTGTSCAMLSLLTCGYPRNDSVIIKSNNFLNKNVNIHGVWPVLINPRLNLIKENCLCLTASISYNSPIPTPEINKGILWIIESRHKDGGWGCVKENGNEAIKSDITSTAYVLKLLRKASCSFAALPQNVEGAIKTALDEGREWLFLQKKVENEFVFWSDNDNNEMAIAETSLSIEALKGYNLFNDNLKRKCLLWMENKNINSEIVRQDFPHHLNWSHLIYERALIALTYLDISVSKPQILKIAKRIIDRQVKEEGFWNISGIAARTAPSWSFLESMVSLKLYLDRIENDWLQEVVNYHEHRINEMEKEIMERKLGKRLKSFFKLSFQFLKMNISITIFLISAFGIFEIIKHQAFFNNQGKITGLCISIFSLILSGYKTIKSWCKEKGISK